MFTGIITDIGNIEEIQKKPDVWTIIISSNFDIDKINIGASISCNGACLTVTQKEKENNRAKLWFDLSPETIEKTIFKSAKSGDKINLEQSLKLGDELGGHLVTGHIDTIAEVKNIEKNRENWVVKFTIEQKDFLKFIADKGSVTINGVSLTVNKVNDSDFEINIIPHTLNNTNLCDLKIGSKVNIEADLIARYLSRLIK